MPQSHAGAVVGMRMRLNVQTALPWRCPQPFSPSLAVAAPVNFEREVRSLAQVPRSRVQTGQLAGTWSGLGPGRECCSNTCSNTCSNHELVLFCEPFETSDSDFSLGGKIPKEVLLPPPPPFPADPPALPPDPSGLAAACEARRIAMPSSVSGNMRK